DEGQEEFVTETEARQSGYKSRISGKPLTRFSEPSYFFRLSKYVPRIIQHIEQSPGFVVPASRRNEVLSKLRAGVEDLSVSRTALRWGIPFPNDPEHVVYVWIDALTNYITALGYQSEDDRLFRKFWPADVHVIGKDILWFHSVYWPALLLSLGLELPRTVAAHGWWVRSGVKAGKSTGGITTLAEIRELVARFGLDSLRYHLLRAAPFGADLEWSLEEFERSFNELANVLGNCLNRTLKMLGKYCRGVLGPIQPSTADLDRSLQAAIDALPGLLHEAYARLDLQQAVLLPIELARQTNGYIDATAPFSLARDPAKADQLSSVLHRSAQAVQRALIGLLPVLPGKAAEGLRQLGVDVAELARDPANLWRALAPGHRVGEGSPLFPRTDPSKPALSG
ncbi:MAG: class I tRNA ligase family protein, partial [Phycisphaerae bacterium]|nr:class I tRNA ligase family protein [Phycisphaerae bacterium]